MQNNNLNKFLPTIRSLQHDQPLTKQDLLIADLLLGKDNDIQMYYAPHNEYINRKAKIVIIGITPGWNQMKTAFTHFLISLSASNPLEICLRDSKEAAAFSGTMRDNLLDMMDQCDIPQTLNIQSSLDLFSESRYLLHTTSMIKYPVFYKGKNYTGHNPPIEKSNLLTHYAYEAFPDELAQITSPALVIPLGKVVEKVIIKLMHKNKLPNHFYLTGFPHPSGANGHRHKQFQQQKHQLRQRVKQWAKND